MNNLKRFTIIGIIFVLITGTLAHFVYDWSGQNHIAGLFTPVNESIWEHIKLLYFPMLIYSVFMVFTLKKDFPCIVSAFCLGILAGTCFIPIFYYAYSFILGKDFFVLDICTFIFSVLLAFWLSYKYTLSCKLESYTLLLLLFVCVLFACFFVFTYHAPNIAIFQEPNAYPGIRQSMNSAGGRCHDTARCESMWPE